MKFFQYIPGTFPIVLSIPHAGTFVPKEISARFTESAKKLPDTDWHVEKLYAFAEQMGIHILIATHSRYVIDLNRSPDGSSLYPGKFTTGLCPTTLFDQNPIYLEGMEPSESEIQERLNRYWRPYHSQLNKIIRELRGSKRIVLFDAHSICSEVPSLFTGILPSLNLGTADGLSANQGFTKKLFDYCQISGFSSTLNQRFKGGYITRHYGNPEQKIDAIQLELTQSCYMKETYPYEYLENKAKPFQTILYGLLSLIVDFVS